MSSSYPGKSRWKHGWNTGQEGREGGTENGLGDSWRGIIHRMRRGGCGIPHYASVSVPLHRFPIDARKETERERERKGEKERELAGSNPPGRRTQFINVPSITTQRLKTLDTEQTSWCLARTNTWHFTLQLPRMPARTGCALVGDKREKLECYSTLVGCPRKALLSFHRDLFSRGGSSSPLHKLSAFRFETVSWRNTHTSWVILLPPLCLLILHALDSILLWCRIRGKTVARMCR